jgi:ADP-heptose:LPS heptosyltransferase
MKEIKEQIVKILREGVDLTGEDKFDESIPYFDDVLGLKEIMVQTYIQRGRAHWEMRRWDKAEKDFKAGLAMAPNNPDIEWTLCLMNLQRGNFRWYGAESRWKSKKFDSPRLKTPAPMWHSGRKYEHLFIWSEQGVGDQIIYLSLLPEVLKEGKKVTVMCDARLHPILARSFPDVEFVSQIAKIKDIDYQIPMGSLPAEYIQDLKNIPMYRAVNYLKPDMEKVKALRDELHDGRKLIGLSWASGAPRIGNHKTIPLMELEPILSLPDTKFVSLQYGNPYAEIFEVEQLTGHQVHVVPQVDNQNAFDDFAALITACDQVVTVSNVTGHFAGALGKPTLLFDSNKLWYWNNREGDNNLWYPSVKTYPRENAVAPWQPQIEMVKEELTGGVKHKPTFVFFRTGADHELWYVRKFVRSLRESNPNAEIIMCTDSKTSSIEGVTRRFEYDSDSTDYMEYRLRIYAELNLDYPAMYLDDDMIVQRRINPKELLGDKRVVFCRRSFSNNLSFNPDIKGLSFEEYRGKSLGEVFPYLACATVTKDASVWRELLHILSCTAPKYRKWYGDQEAMKIMVKTMDEGQYGELSEKDYACLPEYLGDRDPYIIHYKGERKEQMR